MSGRRDARDHVEDMVEALERVVAATIAASDDEVVDPRGSVRGHVLHHLTVLGEAAKHVPVEVTQAHPEIPWTAMCRLRDRIVHYYFGIDDEVLIATVRRSVPEDLPRLRSLLAELRDH